VRMDLMNRYLTLNVDGITEYQVHFARYRWESSVDSQYWNCNVSRLSQSTVESIF
jgi:hypothetical protein